MNELSNFSDDGSGHYKASFGHDDMVMACVQLEFVNKTPQYKIMRDDFASGLSPMEETIYNPFEVPFEWQYIDEDLGNNSSRLGGYRVL